MEKETYSAQGECTNCGRENYPQWGTYTVGKRIEEYSCPKCGCMTWRARGTVAQSDDVGKTSDPLL